MWKSPSAKSVSEDTGLVRVVRFLIPDRMGEMIHGWLDRRQYLLGLPIIGHRMWTFQVRRIHALECRLEDLEAKLNGTVGGEKKTVKNITRT